MGLMSACFATTLAPLAMSASTFLTFEWLTPNKMGELLVVQYVHTGLRWGGGFLPAALVWQ